VESTGIWIAVGISILSASRSHYTQSDITTPGSEQDDIMDEHPSRETTVKDLGEEIWKETGLKLSDSAYKTLITELNKQGEIADSYGPGIKIAALEWVAENEGADEIPEEFVDIEKGGHFQVTTNDKNVGKNEAKIGASVKAYKTNSWWEICETPPPEIWWWEDEEVLLKFEPEKPYKTLDCEVELKRGYYADIYVYFYTNNEGYVEVRDYKRLKK
jgi:hypothetical protein